MIGIELVIFFVSAVLAVLGYLIKQNVNLLLTRLQENKASIDELSREVNDLRVHIANTYVLREDFLREVGYNERRLTLLLGGKTNAES